MLVDEALQKLGLFGKWQTLWYFVLILGCIFPSAWQMVSIVWTSYKPSFHCILPNNESNLDEWIPRKENSELSSCSMYVNASINNDTMECVNGWVFDESISGPTIVSKWNMVCHRSHLADTSQSLMTFGILLGALLFTKLSDTFGRKPILVITQLSMSAIGALTVLPSNLNLFFFLRFILGAFQQGLILSNLVVMCEMFSSEYRPFIAIIATGFWGLGNSILPLVAYLTKNWVVYQLIISLYGFLFIPFFWKLPNSVLWLYANNKLEEAEEILLKAAKMNNITFTQPILNSYNKFDDSKLSSNSSKINGKIKNIMKLCCMKAETSSNAYKYSVLDIFKSKMLFKHLVVCLFMGFVDNLVYYGLTLTTNALSGNHYLNGFINSFVEFPACIIMAFIVKRLGRKRPLAVGHIIAGLSLSGSIVTTLTVGNINTRNILSICLTVIGKFGISSTFAIVFFYTAELFPTNLRNQAVGIAVFFSRLGTVSASYSTSMMERYPYLAPGLFGSLSILVALCIIFVPETHKKALPETIDEIILWYEKPSSEIECKKTKL